MEHIKTEKFQPFRETKENKRVVTPNALIAVGKRVYFSERFTDGFYDFDCDTLKTNYIGRLFSHNEDTRYLYSMIVREKNKLFFIPYNSDCINIYDMQNSEFEYIDLPEEWAEASGRFFCGIVINDKLFLFGYTLAAIGIYNIETRSFELISACVDEIVGSLSENIGQGMYIHSATAIENEIYAVSIFGNFILRINALSCEYELIKLSVRNKGYSHISVKDNALWLTPYSGSDFVKYDISTGECVVLAGNYNACNWSFVGSVVKNDVLFAIPCYGENPLQIDLEKGRITVINEMKAAIGNSERENAFLPPILCGNKIVGCMPYRYTALVFDVISKEARLVKLTTDEKISIENKILFYESPLFGLTDFLECVDMNKYRERERKKNGENIYKKISDHLSAAYY